MYTTTECEAAAVWPRAKGSACGHVSNMRRADIPGRERGVLHEDAAFLQGRRGLRGLLRALGLPPRAAAAPHR